MAVFTALSRVQIEQFLERYAIGTLIEYRDIAEGTENSNFLLRTTHGQYILTLFERRTAVEDLPYFVQVMQQAVAHGVPAPSPVLDSDGQALQQLAQRAALCVTFLSGASTMHPNEAQAYAAGHALAQWHGVAGLPAKPNPYNAQGIAQLAQTIQNTGHAPHAAVAAFLQQAKTLPPLPQTLIHGDYFPDNVLFVDNAVTGIIDVYFSCTDAAVYDLAIALNAWAIAADGTPLPRIARALYEGYNAHRPLSGIEQNALPILCGLAATRFYLTRLYDALHPRPEALVSLKDPHEYVRKMQFFQQHWLW